MTIQEKLLEIQQEINVPKSSHNTFGGFDYRSNEDILTSVKPLLKKHKLTIRQTDEMVAVGERFYIKATTTISDGETWLSASGYAREAETKKGMDESQITGSASSYARKYSASGLFALDDNKDSDKTNTTKEPELTEKQIKEKLEAAANVRELMYLFGKLTADQKIDYQDEFTARKEKIGDKSE